MFKFFLGVTVGAVSIVLAKSKALEDLEKEVSRLQDLVFKLAKGAGLSGDPKPSDTKPGDKSNVN